MTDEQVGCTARFLRLYTGVVLVRYKQHLLRYLEWSTVGLSLEFLTRASGRHAMRKIMGGGTGGYRGYMYPPPFLEGGYKRVHSVKVCVYHVVR